MNVVQHTICYCSNKMLWGVGCSAVLEHLDFGAKGPKFKSHPGSTTSTILIGCAVCTSVKADIILGLVSTSRYSRFTATFSGTDVAGYSIYLCTHIKCIRLGKKPRLTMKTVNTFKFEWHEHGVHVCILLVWLQGKCNRGCTCADLKGERVSIYHNNTNTIIQQLGVGLWF